MALYKIKDFDPNYRDHSDGDSVKDFDLYSGDEKVGSVSDVLVDEDGEFRYLVINTGVWIFGKKVLLPIGRARIDYHNRRAYADHLTKAQVEALPEFSDDLKVDYDYEERVRGVYRSAPVSAPAASGVGYAGYDSAPPTSNAAPPINVDTGYAGYDLAAEKEVYPAPAASGVGYEGYTSAPPTPNAAAPLDLSAGYQGYDRTNYRYQLDPDLYEMTDQNHQQLKQYQERLRANRASQRR